MEFLAVFLVTLIILVGLVVALVVGRSPTYRPSRKDILELLRAVQHDEANPDSWYLFLGMPILHDPDLERFRQRCVVVDEGDDQHPPSATGLKIYAREGRERIGKIADDLEVLIAKEPVYREF